MTWGPSDGSVVRPIETAAILGSLVVPCCSRLVAPLARVNLPLSAVEVRFDKLTIAAPISVGSSGLPTITNAYRGALNVGPDRQQNSVGVVLDTKPHLGHAPMPIQVVLKPQGAST